MSKVVEMLTAVVVWLQGKKTLTVAGLGTILGALVAFGFVSPEAQTGLTGEAGKLMDALVRLVEALVGVAVSLGSVIAWFMALKQNRLAKAIAENTAITKAVAEKTPVMVMLACCLLASGLLAGCDASRSFYGVSGKGYSASLFPRPEVAWTNERTRVTAGVGELATSTTAHLKITATRVDGSAIKPLVQSSLYYPAPNQAVLDVVTPLDWQGVKTLEK
jgi:hypothetical protein